MVNITKKELLANNTLLRLKLGKLTKRIRNTKMDEQTRARILAGQKQIAKALSGGR